MTQPNPFSMANSLEHLVNPKIINNGLTGYQVAVDIANVDTYYGKSVGSSGIRIPDIFVDRLHALQYDLIPTGQPGVTGPTGPLTGIIGGTGIVASIVGNTYTISSNISVVGGNSISVNRNNSTFTINYTGSQGGGGAPITGVSGAYAVFDSTGLQSSTVLNSRNIVGPTGQLMLYSSQGPTYRNHLYTYDGGFPTLVTPYISSRYSNGIINLVPFSNQNFIQSLGTNASSFPLNISGGSGNPVLTTFDIPNGKVIINPNNSGGGVRVLGASTVTQSIYYGTSGATYNLYLYGGGGAGLSGFGGGAGGFVQVNGITAGSQGITFSFNNIASTPGGGNSLGLLVNGITAAIAPGGGGGGSRGVGAAYGEPGGSYNGQGFSAINGVTGGLGGSFAVNETNGTIGFNYRLGTTAIAQSGIFNNIRVEYGLTGYLSPGTKILGYGVIPNVIGTSFATYYFPPGSTMVFQTNGVTFENSSYSFTGITFGILDLSLPLSSITSTTFPRQASGGTFINNPLLTNQQFQSGYVSGSFTGDGSGIDQLLIGQTFSIGLTGLTLKVNYGTQFEDFGITGGIQINFSGGLTFNFSRSLGSVIAPSVKITDPISIAPNSIIQVQTQVVSYNGNNGSSLIGGSQGGGGGFQGGGGGTGGGGGGAGLALISTGFSGIIGAGSGLTPFYGTYNSAGQYSFGGSGGQGGTPYYVIELVTPGLEPDVLQVNGNETVSGGLTVSAGLTISGKITGAGNNSVYASNDITSNSTINGSVITAYSNIPQGGLFRSYTTPGAAYVPINCPDGVFSGGQIYSVGNIIGNSGLTISPSMLPAPGAGNIVASGTITGQDLIATSDKRLKQNIQTVDSALDKVSKLRGVYFTRNGSEKRNIGLIAQEIEEILPEVVYTDESPEQIKSVAYGNIIGLLIEAIKELKELKEVKKNTN